MPYLFCFILLFTCLTGMESCSYQNKQQVLPSTTITATTSKDTIPVLPDNDSLLYVRKMKQLANGDKTGRWPPQLIFPSKGAILPYKRIVAYYGNFYSTHMGILGQFTPDKVLEKLKEQIAVWELADTLTPVLPAIHYIAVTAQRSPGAGKKYRLRMPDNQIEKAIKLATMVNGIVFLDIQVGHSTLKEEIPALKKYLQLPQVHLGIDPEFSMKNGRIPGTSIGTFDAADINFAAEYLSNLVKEYGLPPKIMVIHRFTNEMLTNYKKLIPYKEVQPVINMDGFGFPAKKKNTYYHCITKEPVQFAGFKLFYKNDTRLGSSIMSPAEILQLKPQPIYIQYQ